MDQKVSLDGLMGHLSASTGLYSRETFLNLYSSVVKTIRQYQLEGIVLYRDLGDPDFLPLGLAVEQLPTITAFTIKEPDILGPASLNEDLGFIVVLTDRFCASVFWHATPEEEIQNTLNGGWTFHPGDCKIIAEHISQLLENHEVVTKVIENTRLDRRYDIKTQWFISQLVSNLDHRNRELTMALKKNQDLSTKMVDQERLAAIGQLCSVVAHEIRNPLGLIDLYAKLIEKQLEKIDIPEGKDNLEKNLQLIRSATTSLESILSELTQYARPLELDKARVDLRDLVTEVLEMVQPKFEEQQVNLTWKLPSEQVMVDADGQRIRQALLNLVKNALEVSPEQSTVHVHLNLRANDDRLFVKVTDQGKGVEEKFRHKLFTPYFSTKGNGTGLGLAHSRKILQAHGGNVVLLKTSEEGSTFALVLPYHPSQKPSQNT